MFSYHNIPLKNCCSNHCNKNKFQNIASVVSERMKFDIDKRTGQVVQVEELLRF